MPARRGAFGAVNQLNEENAARWRTLTQTLKSKMGFLANMAVEFAEKVTHCPVAAVRVIFAT